MKLKGTFVSLIKSQQTSRVCQFYIEQSPNEVVHLIFTELADQLPQLLLDPYANYFCLKLFFCFVVGVRKVVSVRKLGH